MIAYPIDLVMPVQETLSCGPIGEEISLGDEKQRLGVSHLIR